jgi:hypothetical protein
VTRSILQCLFVLVTVLGSCSDEGPMASEFVRADLGTLSANARVDGKLSLRNRTPRPWRVTDVQVDCGCVVLTGTTMEVAPGAELAINFTFHASGFTGDIVRSVSVNLEGGGTPLKGEIVARISSGAFFDVPSTEAEVGKDGTTFFGMTHLYVPSTSTMLPVVRVLCATDGITAIVEQASGSNSPGAVIRYVLSYQGALSGSAQSESHHVWVEIQHSDAEERLHFRVTAIRRIVARLSPAVVLLDRTKCRRATINFAPPADLSSEPVTIGVSPMHLCDAVLSAPGRVDVWIEQPIHTESIGTVSIQLGARGIVHVPVVIGPGE